MKDMYATVQLFTIKVDLEGTRKYTIAHMKLVDNGLFGVAWV